MTNFETKEAVSPTSGFDATLNNTNQNTVSNVLNGITDQSAQSLLNVINSNSLNGVQSMNGAVMGHSTCPTNENVQYYFTMPGDQNLIGSQGQSLNLQGIQGLQGAQIVINSNGQPTIFVGSRDGC